MSFSLFTDKSRSTFIKTTKSPIFHQRLWQSKTHKHTSESNQNHKQTHSTNWSHLRMAIEWGAGKKHCLNSYLSLFLKLVWTLMKPQSIFRWVHKLEYCFSQVIPGVFSISEGIKLLYLLFKMQNNYNHNTVSEHLSIKILPMIQLIQCQILAHHLISTISHTEAGLSSLSNPYISWYINGLGHEAWRFIHIQTIWHILKIHR